jgi:hypothetical protein
MARKITNPLDKLLALNFLDIGYLYNYEMVLRIEDHWINNLIAAWGTTLRKPMIELLYRRLVMLKDYVVYGLCEVFS